MLNILLSNLHTFSCYCIHFHYIPERYHSSHFTEEETEVQRGRYLPKIT